MSQGADNIEWSVEPLGAGHGVADFDCGEDEVNGFIRRHACENAARNISRTFVIAEPGSAKVVGFYALCMGEVRFANPPEKLPRYPMPVILLAQLGVDKSQQGRGMGAYLLVDALARAERLNEHSAAYAVRVDATHEKARAFYLKYGFIPLADKPLHLFLAMKRIKLLHLNGPGQDAGS